MMKSPRPSRWTPAVPAARVMRLTLAAVAGCSGLLVLLLLLASAPPSAQAAPPARPQSNGISDTMVVTHTAATTHQMSVFADGRLTTQFLTDNGYDQVDVELPTPNATTLAIMFDEHAATGNGVDVGAQGELTPTTLISLNTPSAVPGFAEDTHVVYASGVLSYQVAQRTLATTTNNCVIMELAVENTGGGALTDGKLLYMVDIDVALAEAGDEGFYDPSRRLVYARDFNPTDGGYGYAMGISLLEGDWGGYAVNGSSYPQSDTALANEMITPSNTISDGLNNVSWIVANVPDLTAGQATTLVFGLCARTAPGPEGVATEEEAVSRMKQSFDRQASLALSKGASPSPGSRVTAGERITYSIAITSTGYWYVDNIVVTDTIPAATDLITYSTTHGSIAASNGLVTATIGRLYPSSGTVTVTLVAAPPITTAGATVITNQAFVRGEPIITATRPITHLILPAPPLSLTKSVDPAPVVAGESLTYTIVVSNSGPGVAIGVVVTDSVPAETTFVTGTTPHTGPVAGVVTWSLGTLAGGATRTITMVVRVNSSVISGTVVTNTARATSSQGPTETGTITTTTGGLADLQIGKAASPPAVLGGGEVITYTLAYTNAGPSDAQGVTITDTLPYSVTYGGVVGEVPPITGPVENGRLLTWYTPTLAAGASGTIAFTVTVDAGASDSLTNTVVITSGTPDPATSNNEAESVVLIEVHGLIITKTAVDLNGIPLYAGDEIEYRVVVTSTSAVYSQTNVVIADPMPANTSLVSGSVSCSPGASYELVGSGPMGPAYILGPLDFGGLIVLTMESLSPGEVLTLTFRAKVSSGVSSIGGNVAVVQSDQHSSLETPPVCPPAGCAVEPGLVIAKTATDANGSPLQEGDTIAYQVVVTNSNPTRSQTNVTISDTVPVSTTLVASSVDCTPGATCGESGGVVTANIGSLSAGQVLTLTFQVTVDSGAVLIGGNVAAVESDNQGECRTGQVYPGGGGSVFQGAVYLPLVMRNY